MMNPSVSSPVSLPKVFEKLDTDYHFLIQCFCEVLDDSGEHELSECVRRALNEGHSPLPVAVHSGAEKEMHALSVAFQLLNLVEENAAAQARRRREATEDSLREPGLWGQNLRQLRDAGFTGKQIAERLGAMHVEPVLTAHPTESKRPTVLQIHRALYLLIVQLENQMWTPNEREEIHSQIKAVLERLWRTGEIFLSKPNVQSELDNLLYYLREVFPPVLARLDLRLQQAWVKAGFDPADLSEPEKFPRLSFGSWVGGDRDGHPLVTSEVTQAALAKMRATAIEIVVNQLELLADRLSLSSRHQDTPHNLRGAMIRLVDELGDTARPALDRNKFEPWRQYVNLLLTKLKLPNSSGMRGYANGRELAEDLAILRRSLISVGAQRLANAYVFPVERLVRVFGLQLASLDIRQNSAYHDRVVEQLLQAAGMPEINFSEWPEEKRLAFLQEELKSPRPFVPPRANLGAEARELLAVYRVIADHVDRTGGEGIGSLIISMTRSLSDLLVVYLLAREVGLARAESNGLVCSVPVVPLLETVSDLQHAPEILSAFLEHPITKRSLSKLRGDHPRPRQQVMVGYSDSNKDGGILAAQWRVHQAQDELAHVGERLGVDIVFFHGRGGTTSRGAGPTHRFLEALPHGSLMGSFRLTEQGETIAQKYANQITATYNLELLLAGVTGTTIKHARFEEDDERLTAIIERLAQLSKESYTQLITSEGFLDFWSQATPIDALENSTIGSRPARRTGKRTMADLRAIPWVFSWNQARFYLPGWYGLGTSLETMKKTDPTVFAFLIEHGVCTPFLRFVLTNSETSLASANLEIMNEYAQLVSDRSVREKFLGIIRDEYERTERMIDELFQAPRRERRPRMIKTLELRNAGLHCLHRQQIALLREWRALQAEGNVGAGELLPTVLLSVNAIASGLRTTG